jgi:hypothetical protein
MGRLEIITGGGVLAGQRCRGPVEIVAREDQTCGPRSTIAIAVRKTPPRASDHYRWPPRARATTCRAVSVAERTAMPTLREAAEEFLAQPRLAVAGVSRDTKQPANLIYRRLRATGHQVFAINPNADEVEGDRSYPNIASIPDQLDGVVIATTPAVAESLVADCVSTGVPRVWLHRGIGPGSMSDNAVVACREHGIAVIPGGCPNMFGATSDPAHKCMRVLLKLTGKIPRDVEEARPRSGPSE